MTSLLFPIDEDSRVGEARRAAAELATRLAFDERTTGRLALVVNEIARNILNHAKSGELLLRVLSSSNAFGVEVLGIDKGPGIGDIGRALHDGFSTQGTAGTGLGAIKRLSQRFDLYSQTNKGTVVLSQIWGAGGDKAARTPLSLGVVHLPKPGEQECGDQWATSTFAGRPRIIVADGLGHGPEAARAGFAARKVFLDSPEAVPIEVLRQAHLALRSTRGAAVAIVELNLARESLTFVGVGNIAGASVFAAEADGASRHFVSMNGTVGYEARTFKSFDYPFPAGAVLVLHSDGLMSRWDLSRYPGLCAKQPSVIAAVLYRDFARGTDDLTAVVGKRA